MDILPKITDIKNLKDLCKVIVLPMLCACYVSYGDFSLDFGDFVISLSSGDTEGVRIFKALVILSGKILFSASMCFLIYFGLVYAHVYSKAKLIPVCILILMTFGFLGVFAGDKVESILPMEGIWYYTSFVTAFFLLAMLDQVTE